jgi:murein DD-endopeptidase MepM/ murein hydrolase activator NlpD
VQGAELPPPPDAPPAYASASPQPYTPPSSYASVAPAVQVASAQSTQRGAPPTTLGDQAGQIRQPAQQSGGAHLVQSGDTAWNISRRYGITVDQLAAANGGSTNIKLGQRLVIPGGAGQQLAAPQPAPAGVQLASLNPQEIPPAPAPAQMPEVPPAAAADTTPMPAQTDAQPAQQVALAPQTGEAGSLAPAAPESSAAAEASGFRWPVRGRIISGFGKRPNGERNDGINLAVPEGTSVKAAEDGTVIYAGNELKSYGNLVLIRQTQRRSIRCST